MDTEKEKDVADEVIEPWQESSNTATEKELRQLFQQLFDNRIAAGDSPNTAAGKIFDTFLSNFNSHFLATALRAVRTNIETSNADCSPETQQDHSNNAEANQQVSPSLYTQNSYQSLEKESELKDQQSKCCFS